MPTTVLARLREHIEPMDRGSRYEDPVDAVLRERGLGQVTGGGSQLGESGELEYADIELELANLDDALSLVIDSLERAGAPVGSEILGDGGLIREFGTLQSVAVYLDGVSLPDDVYANLDFDETIRTLTEAAGESSYHGYWQGPEETGLFFFHTDAETLFDRLEPVLRSLPIGQNARVVIRPRFDSPQIRTVRMPRHQPPAA